MLTFFRNGIIVSSLALVALLSTPIASVASPTVPGTKKHELLVVNATSKSERKCKDVEKDKRSIKVIMTINASPRAVWKAISESRTDDPDVKFTKITKISETQKLLEQKYVSLPFLGSTTCVLQVNEDPLKRIDYELVRSEHLSEFDGTWILSESEDGKSTLVEVTNHLKLKFPMPQKIVDSFARHKLRSRVQIVKSNAEAAELQLVHAPESVLPQH